MSTAPAGWYPDPEVPGKFRYWDGSAWIGQTQTAEQRARARARVAPQLATSAPISASRPVAGSHQSRGSAGWIIAVVVVVLISFISCTTMRHATARCEDGTMSYSTHHSGTCSWHGGVSEWLP